MHNNITVRILYRIIIKFHIELALKLNMVTPENMINTCKRMMSGILNVFDILQIHIDVCKEQYF